VEVDPRPTVASARRLNHNRRPSLSSPLLDLPGRRLYELVPASSGWERGERVLRADRDKLALEGGPRSSPISTPRALCCAVWRSSTSLTQSQIVRTKIVAPPRCHVSPHLRRPLGTNSRRGRVGPGRESGLSPTKALLGREEESRDQVSPSASRSSQLFGLATPAADSGSSRPRATAPRRPLPCRPTRMTTPPGRS